VVAALSRTYPQAIAGTPTSVRFSPLSGAFHMTYTPSKADGPTSIFIAQDEHYPHGWCATVRGGVITSPPGASHLLVRPVDNAARVVVAVTGGHCLPTH
jgi:endoglycosylceramidase